MKKIDLEREIARLESINDHLLTEMAYLDELLRLTGFSRGLESLKEVAIEIIEQQNLEK